MSSHHLSFFPVLHTYVFIQDVNETCYIRNNINISKFTKKKTLEKVGPLTFS